MRRHFSNCYRVDASGDVSIQGMLNALELDFEGRQHSGIDDARNIARIMQQMIKDGWVLGNNKSV
jgi:inhibitor of KinA sporulation pathway (predicted exonuclease)